MCALFVSMAVAAIPITTPEAVACQAHKLQEQHQEIKHLKHSNKLLHSQLRSLRRKLASKSHSLQLIQRNSYSTQTTQQETHVTLGVSSDSSIVQNLLCIHKYEGAWNSNTGNGYFGGLQFDADFMQTYGPEFLQEYGTADKWPVQDQLIAAERAVRVRSYSPWPNSSRLCGL